MIFNFDPKYCMDFCLFTYLKFMYNRSAQRQIFVNHLYLSGKSYQVMLPMKILFGNYMSRSWTENMQTSRSYLWWPQEKNSKNNHMLKVFML